MPTVINQSMLIRLTGTTQLVTISRLYLAHLLSHEYSHRKKNSSTISGAFKEVFFHDRANASEIHTSNSAITFRTLINRTVRTLGPVHFLHTPNVSRGRFSYCEGHTKGPRTILKSPLFALPPPTTNPIRGHERNGWWSFCNSWCFGGLMARWTSVWCEHFFVTMKAITLTSHPNPFFCTPGVK